MFNRVIKAFSSPKVLEKKSSPNSPFFAFANFLAYNGWTNLSAYAAMYYYMQVSPLSDAISTIAKGAADVEVYVFDKKSQAFLDDHPLLDKLNAPNSDMAGTEFMRELISYYLITGNAFICATGDYTKEPKEIFNLNPGYITFVPSTIDGFTEVIKYSSNIRTYDFKRIEEPGSNRFRYITDDGLREVYHIREFNPLRGVINGAGMSQLTPIYYEIEQFIKSGVHNLSLLTRGARPSGILTTEEILSDDQIARLQQQMDLFNSGPENAGRVLFMDNGIKFQETGISNKDMDFAVLKQDLRMQIYNTFKIPLALISKETMAYNNLAAANLMLYDQAILPNLKFVLEELSHFLMGRYKKLNEKQKLVLTYNKDSIPALTLRRNEELKLVKELGVNSINELRTMKGDEPVEGGEGIYISPGLVDITTVSEEAEEEEQGNEEEAATDFAKVAMQDYILLAKRLKDKDGKPLYTEKELLEYAKEYRLGESECP